MFSDQEIKAYEHDGLACLRQVIDKSWIERLAKASQDVRQAPSSGSRQFGDQQGKFFIDRFLWTFNEVFKDFAFNSPLPRIAAEFMRSKSVFLMTDIIFTKDPNSKQITPWHHDQPYGWYDGSQLCQFWIPLDKVDLGSGALELIRGSHRWGKWFNVVDFKAQKDETQDLDKMPDIEADRSRFDIVHYDMEPGDCILFSELTVHSSPANRSPRPRHGLALHYAGDDSRYVMRSYTRKPPYDPGIKPGDPFGCELFPKVWQAA